MNKRLISFISILVGFTIAFFGLTNWFGDQIHDFFIVSGVKHATIILDVFQYNPTIGFCGGLGQDILVNGAGIVRVETGCDGVDLLAVYMAFALAFPGPALKKIWFIPLGLLAIYILNTVRIAVLVMLKAEFGTSVMEFNHKFTFIILVYSFIFILWYLWIKKFAIPHAQRSVA